MHTPSNRIRPCGELMPPGLFGSTTIDCSACMEKANTLGKTRATGVVVAHHAQRPRLRPLPRWTRFSLIEIPPSSVGVNPWVERSNRRTPRRSSSCAIVLENGHSSWPRRNCVAAPENDPGIYDADKRFHCSLPLQNDREPPS